MNNEQLLSSIPTADLLRELVKREGANYMFTDNNKNRVHVVMFNDYYVGIGTELHDFETILDKKELAKS